MSNENPSWGRQSQTIWDEQPHWHADPEATGSDDEATPSSPILGDTVVLSTEAIEACTSHRKHIGYATEPGYIDNMDKWGNRPIDEYPKHV